MGLLKTAAIAGIILASLQNAALADTASTPVDTAQTATAVQFAILAPGAPAFLTVRDGALDRLRARATAGDSGAAFALSSQMLSGTPDQATIDEGLKWLRQAADAGVNDARTRLASVLSRGLFGVQLDHDGAVKLFQAAVDAGDVSALAPLGQLVLDTEFDPAARAHALSLLEKGSQAGDIGAATTLGELYASGAGVPLDAKKALGYFDSGLVAGNASASLDAASLLRSGSIGLPADPAAALSILNELYARGNISAARQIADMYLNGDGVEPSAKTAVSLLETLAVGGDAASYVTLADLYSSGEFFPIDATRAVGYYEKATAAGSKSAAVRLAGLYLQGLGGLSPDPVKAMALYNSALLTGGPQAKRTLALTLLTGDVSIADPTRGLDLLKQAADEGDSGAAKQLGQIYADNALVLADYDESKKYFSSAVVLGDYTAVVDLAHALATGPLAGEHHDEAQKLLTAAVESHVPGAATEMARLQLAGAFPGRGVEDVLTGLLNASRDGDIAAGRFLIHLYRDGSGLVLQPNRKAAEATLASLSDLLGPEVSAVERIGLEAGAGSTVSVYESIEADLQSLPPSSQVRILRQLRSSNTRAFVYIVQKHLADAGMYSGPLQGSLDNTTIRAIMKACTAAGALPQCTRGPLTNEAVKALTTYLFGAKSADAT